jgi:hypothetical protein
MDELDEIAQLEAAGQKLMVEPDPTPRKRSVSSSSSSSASQGKSKPTVKPTVESGNAPHVENLLMEIRDRLDLLLQGNIPETQAPEEAGQSDLAIAEEPDLLRNAFPHEPDDAVSTAAANTAAVSMSVALSDSDMARLLSTVEDRVTSHALTHHSSVVVLLGWAMALLAAGLGMGYGYIVAAGRYPFWAPTSGAGILAQISAAYLAAPVGVVLLPLAGAILWMVSKEAHSNKQQVILRLAAVGVFLAGILLPLISLL